MRPDGYQGLGFSVSIPLPGKEPSPAVFFDRDGVLVETVVTPAGVRAAWSPEEFRVLPGAKEAIERVAKAGFLAIVVTNQPDVAFGSLRRLEAERLNALLLSSIPALTETYTCFHAEIDGCPCRKPRAGLLFGAAHHHSVDLPASWMVGDRWVDVAAGRAAGCRTVLVENDLSWAPTSSGVPDPDLEPNLVASNVSAAVAAILAHSLGNSSS